MYLLTERPPTEAPKPSDDYWLRVPEEYEVTTKKSMYGQDIDFFHWDQKRLDRFFNEASRLFDEVDWTPIRNKICPYGETAQGDDNTLHFFTNSTQMRYEYDRLDWERTRLPPRME